MDKVLPDSASLISKVKSSKSIYLLIIPVFLLLITVALAIYYYGIKKPVTPASKESSALNVNQIEALKENERIIRGEVISMAGRVLAIEETGVRLTRQEQEIFLPKSDSVQIFLQEFPVDKDVYVDDNGFGATGDPIQLNVDKKIAFSEIQANDQLLIFFEKDDKDNLSSKYIYLFRNSL